MGKQIVLIVLTCTVLIVSTVLYYATVKKTDSKTTHEQEHNQTTFDTGIKKETTVSESKTSPELIAHHFDIPETWVTTYLPGQYSWIQTNQNNLPPPYYISNRYLISRYGSNKTALENPRLTIETLTIPNTRALDNWVSENNVFYSIHGEITNITPFASKSEDGYKIEYAPQGLVYTRLYVFVKNRTVVTIFDQGENTQEKKDVLASFRFLDPK